MSSIPTYIIDLDEEPKKRWSTIIKDYKLECLEFINKMEKMVSSASFGSIVKNFIVGIAKVFEMLGLVMYKEELQGVANELGISTGKLILGQVAYEFFAKCSSIVVKHNDRNIHYRTMDWGMTDLSRLTVQLVFQRNYQTVFVATSWVGYIGIMTGMLPNKYSVSLNFRKSDGTIFGNVKRLMGGSWPIGYLIRWLLENEMSYNDACNHFRKASLVSPCYITLCNGNGESAIFVRDYDKCVIEKKQGHSNYLIQTNIDPDCEDEEKDILWSIERKCLVKEIIRSNIKDWNKSTDIYKDLKRSFNIHPLMNEITIYVCIMDPQKNKYINFLP